MSERRPDPLRDPLEHAIGDVRTTPIPAEVPAEWIASTVEAIRNPTSASTASAEEIRQQRRKRIMRYVKFGSVAGIAASALVVVGLLVLTPTRSAAEDVAAAMENFQTAKSYQHVTKMTMDGKTMFDMRMYKQNNRMRFEAGDIMVMIVDDKENVLQLEPKTKTAKRPTLAELKAMSAGLRGNTEEFSKKLLALKGDGVQRVDDEKLGEVTAHVYLITGIKLNDHESDWKIWVDPKRKLPIRMDMIKGNAGANITVVSEFSKWNETFDDKLFSLDIPEGYTLKETAKDTEKK
jgi:outer membrane lipoprotein-sorting protein